MLLEEFLSGTVGLQENSLGCGSKKAYSMVQLDGRFFWTRSKEPKEAQGCCDDVDEH
jgi:hypothetical protein